RTPVGPLRQAIGLSAGAESLATRLAMEPFGTPPTGQPFMAVDAQAGMNREVWADAQDPPAELRVREIEVVLPDEAVAHVDVVAPLREADGPARILPALEDDGDPLVPAKLPVERCDPLRAAHVFRRRDQVQVVVLGDGVNKVRGVGGKRPDVSGRPVDGRPRVLAKAQDASRWLQPLHHRVHEETITTRVGQPTAVLVMVNESVHGGPPFMAGWPLP